MPRCDRKEGFLALTDWLSNYRITIPLINKSAIHITNALRSAMYMICSTNVLFITDEDAVFKGEKFQSFLIETNSNIQFLTPYTTHNALLVESVTIRTIKARLRRINQDFSKFNWVKYLPTITFQSNIMPRNNNPMAGRLNELVDQLSNQIYEQSLINIS